MTATSLTATPSTLNTGQAFTVTLALAKTGTAAANVTAATLTRGDLHDAADRCR